LKAKSALIKNLSLNDLSKRNKEKIEGISVLKKWKKWKKWKILVFVMTFQCVFVKNLDISPKKQSRT
jgi:hypothetical protein